MSAFLVSSYHIGMMAECLASRDNRFATASILAESGLPLDPNTAGPKEIAGAAASALAKTNIGGLQARYPEMEFSELPGALHNTPEAYIAACVADSLKIRAHKYNFADRALAGACYAYQANQTEDYANSTGGELAELFTTDNAMALARTHARLANHHLLPDPDEVESIDLLALAG